jgi:glutamine amidotransferase
MTAIIDYGAGNLFSLRSALENIGEKYIITSEERSVLSADRIILPGVGEASGSMNLIKSMGIDSILLRSKVPVLGICIGMQLLCNYSEEGDTDCLGYFSTKVEKLKSDYVKIPHMGWNRVTNLRGPLFDGVDEGEWFYFVHSYAPVFSSSAASVTEHGVQFSSSLQSGRFYGTQFHPEKSGEAGERILRNFLKSNQINN